MMLNEQIFDLEIAPANRKDTTFTKFEAYIFLLVSDSKKLSNYYLAKTWGWSRTKVKNFIEYIEENSLLVFDKKDIEKNTKKDREKNNKKYISKFDNINDSVDMKNIKKDSEKDMIKNAKRDVPNDVDLGSIQAILNM